MQYGVGGGGTTATILVDAETPVGVINGVNPNFTLGSIPSPVLSLELWKNGILQLGAGVDYTLIGNLISYQAAAIPAGVDNHLAFYRTTNNTVINAVFIPDEIPVGAINGVNAAYTLANVPNPAASLQLFKNGVLMIAGGVDYTLVGLNITYVAAQIPQVGDTHIADYRTSTGVFVNPVFVDAEVPAGVINGVNAVFTLLFAPNPGASLNLFKNGVFMTPAGVDYTLVGLTITFVAGQIPAGLDTLVAFYQR